MRELRRESSINAVYDLTIAYAHKGRFLEAPTMWDTLSRSNLDRDFQFYVHADRFDIQDFADKTDAELAQWLEDRWIVKSRKLESLQRELGLTKHFSASTEDPHGKKTL